MNVINPENAAHFFEKTRETLEKDEVNGNLIFGIASSLIKNKNRYGDENPFYSIVYDGDKINVIGLMTPPHKLLAYGTNLFDNHAIELFVNNIIANKKRIPGITAEIKLAEMFARMWTLRTECEFKIETQLRCFKLDSVNSYAKPEGLFRVATINDIETIEKYVIDFSNDVNEPINIEKLKERILDELHNGLYYLWENNDIVSIAKKIRETKNGMAVGCVYTPEQYRNNGYATAVVSEISRAILQAGKRFCTLYTNLSNPTSNSIYQKIGYNPISDSISYGFEYKRSFLW